uniref:Transposase n=1 Tax=Candidatus Kentrum sp. TUN TaxID=2126343 RepID=A0A451A6N3_9GAMM|nr:MAG: Transposase [Candidatus Kentron sp. TUN]VFK52204.1 MAG: Transposase [Candidatus Kentron sp. TUN]VFK61693.1 MAG: Transposase [Candidatus Kentron sp. TUN]
MLKGFADTLGAYRSGILPTMIPTAFPPEGTNNKIKIPQKMAYGFRDLNFSNEHVSALRQG